jgi:RimJ/RimL family protein N-acetyltransferase
VGYWVAPQARGRGVATAAVRLLSAAAFEQLDLIRLDLIVAVGNVASVRVAEKAGYTREGVMRSYLATKKNGRDDAVMFGLVRGDAG